MRGLLVLRGSNHMKKLLQGIEQFRDRVYPKYKVAFKSLEHSQKPLALFITCADSRVDPSLLMQTDPGDLFICRNAGNLVPPYMEDGAVEATVEYAVDGLKIRDIVVCGHSDCGAMKAALNPAATERLPPRRWLRHVPAPAASCRTPITSRRPRSYAVSPKRTSSRNWTTL